MEKLRQHILSSPDGEAYFSAKEHYEKTVKSITLK